MKHITKRMTGSLIVFLSLAFIIFLPTIIHAAAKDYLKVNTKTYNKYVSDDDFNVNYSSKNVKNIKWKSSDTDVAIVDKKGKVSIKGPGTATITVTAKGISSKSSLKATAKVVVATPVITCSKSEVVMKKETTQTISVSVKNYPGYEIAWSSTDSDIVDVDTRSANSATLTARDYGEATITAYLEEVGEVEIHVTVLQPDMTCSVSSLDLVKGSYKSVSVSLSNVPKSDLVSWESSDERVASTFLSSSSSNNRTIKITARDYGTATVTAYLGDKDSGLSVSIQVNVPYPTVSVSTASKTLRIGRSGSVYAKTVNMPKTDNITWTVSDPSILSINSSGTRNYKVSYTALKEGEVVVTATVPGGSTAYFTVYVTP